MTKKKTVTEVRAYTAPECVHSQKYPEMMLCLTGSGDIDSLTEEDWGEF